MPRFQNHEANHRLIILQEPSTNANTRHIHLRYYRELRTEMTQNRALSDELLRLNKSFAMWVSPLEIAAENWEYERLWLSFISDLKYVGETRYRSSYHKIICTVQLRQNVLKTGNLPFRRSISRVISRDFCCKQTAKVRTLGQLPTTRVGTSPFCFR